MGRKLENITFEEWIAFVFDHPAAEAPREQWYHLDLDSDSDWWDDEAQPLVTISYLTRLFENPSSTLKPYSDAQIREGLWSLLSAGDLFYMSVVRRAEVPWSERKHCAEAMFVLFKQLFQARCTPTLSYMDESGANPINSVCYMWFDILPIFANMDEPHNKPLEQVTLDVMRRILDLDSIACQESALHGLNHWQPYYPDQVLRLINAYLERNTALRPELRKYALIAREGMAQ